MTLKGATTPACAACKYQRKRCTPECPLAPHFRPEQTEIFRNAHKLFGVRNILRILEQIDPAQKNEAMRSIIYQANMRDRFPVHGCFGVIYELQCHIRQTEKELYTVLSQLEFYKQRRQVSPLGSPESQQALTLFQHEVTEYPAAALPVLSYEGYNGNSGVHVYSKENMNMGNVLWAQQIYCNENNDNNVKALQGLNIQEEVTHDYDDVYQFFDGIDDTQSYIDSKEANESSSESSLKETTQCIQHVSGNGLRSAELQLGIVSEDYQVIA